MLVQGAICMMGSTFDLPLVKPHLAYVLTSLRW